MACQTYRKQPYEPWPQEEFADTPVRLKNGTTVIWKLAERGVLFRGPDLSGNQRDTFGDTFR